MRLIVLFAPVFFEWPKAVVKEMQALDPTLEVIAITNTRILYDRLVKDQAEGHAKFHAIEYYEDHIRDWLSKPYDPELLKHYEEKLGIETVSNILIADRQAAQGFITCAGHMDSELAAMLKDHDKKRAYICGQIDYFTKLFEKYQINAGLYHAIATSFTVTMTELMERRGGKNLVIVHSRVDDRMLIDTDKKGFLGPVARRLVAGENPAPASLEKAYAWLTEYRMAMNKEPDYMAFVRGTMKQAFSVTGIAKRFVYAVYDWLFGKHEQTIYNATAWSKVVDALAVPYRIARQRRTTEFVDFQIFKDRPFVYYALHVDPESSTMHLAPQHTNQLAVIEALAKQKPLHMDLLVKEHPNMIGKRPTDFYQKIANMPGVYLVSSDVPSLSLIRHAKLVATISGTVLWEAMLLGVPSLVVGDSPFLHNKGLDQGVVFEPDLSALTDAIAKAFVTKPASDQDITRFLGVLFEETFPLDVSLIWKNNSPEHVAKNKDAVDVLARNILARMKDDGDKVALQKVS